MMASRTSLGSTGGPGSETGRDRRAGALSGAAMGRGSGAAGMRGATGFSLGALSDGGRRAGGAGSATTGRAGAAGATSSSAWARLDLDSQDHAIRELDLLPARQDDAVRDLATVDQGPVHLALVHEHQGIVFPDHFGVESGDVLVGELDIAAQAAPEGGRSRPDLEALARLARQTAHHGQSRSHRHP